MSRQKNRMCFFLGGHKSTTRKKARTQKQNMSVAGLFVALVGGGDSCLPPPSRPGHDASMSMVLPICTFGKEGRE